MSKDPASILFTVRESFNKRLPPRHVLPVFINSLLGALFPHFSDKQINSEHELTTSIKEATDNLKTLVDGIGGCKSAGWIEAFTADLPKIQRALVDDAFAIQKEDPAAKSVDEVMLAYPGFFAIAIFRIAHSLYQLEVPLIPRMLTEYAHERTGVDIHPGATIGRSFVIDHGTGIVIGETTLIKDHVKIFQGVTLGALSVEKSLANTKRHPTIESNVVIYANATILGGSTVIGEGSVIGGNVWITASVEPKSTVYHRAEIGVKE